LKKSPSRKTPKTDVDLDRAIRIFDKVNSMKNKTLVETGLALQWVAASLLVLAWLIPNHQVPWKTFHSDSAAAIALIVFVLALGKNWSSIKCPPIVWVLAGVAAIPPLQWAFGLLTFSGDAFVSALYVLGFAVAIAVGFLHTRLGHDKLPMALSVAALVGSLLSSFISLAQGLQIPSLGVFMIEGVPAMRPYGNMAQPNNLATLIGFGLLGLLYLRERTKLSALPAILMLFVMLIGLSFTQSRTALVMGPIAFVCVFMARRRGISFKTSLLTIVAVTLVHWLMTWSYPTLQSMLLFQGAPSIIERSQGSLRLRIWTLLMAALGNSPWFGFGWLQVGAAQLSVAEQFPPIGEYFSHAHNLFFDLLLWCGYPIGAALSLLVVHWTLTRWMRTSNVDGVIAMCLVLFFGFHCMLELPHHYAFFLIPVGLWIGFIEVNVGAKEVVPAKFYAVLPLIAMVLCLGIWKDYLQVEEDYDTSRFQAKHIHPEEPIPLPSADYSDWILTPIDQLRFSKIVPHPAMSEEDLRFMDSVVKRFASQRAMVMLGLALSLNGRTGEATQIIVKLGHTYGEGSYQDVKDFLQERLDAGDAGVSGLLAALPKKL
jgi:Virulence factor membrane-bound polymerase, C-terminal/O-Antigen ligase/Protein glycosylation ligase